MAGDELMQRALEIALSLDHQELKAWAVTYRAEHPGETNDDLVDRLVSRARWKGAAVGFGTGLPANPWVMVPAAIADVGAMIRIEVGLAARIALLYDETYLDDPEPPYELMVPIMGGRLMGEFAKELAIQGGMGMTRAAIRKVLTKQTLKQFQKVMLKYFGLKVTQKAVIAKSLPIVGGLLGGGWNFVELNIVGKRVREYFKGGPLSAAS